MGPCYICYVDQQVMYEMKFYQNKHFTVSKLGTSTSSADQRVICHHTKNVEETQHDIVFLLLNHINNKF